jgi:four helix bundle protein
MEQWNDVILGTFVYSEGCRRRSLKEYLRHLNIALGSCGEFY